MTEIRSYRRVFELERRLYRIDRLRLNPGGVPVRSVVYFLVLLLACLTAGSVPLLGVLVQALPWYARDLALPAASAALLTAIRVDGRSFHVALQGLLRYHLLPRHLAGLRPCRPEGEVWWPSDLVVLPDGSDPTMRRLRYRGPGAVLVAVEHERAGRSVQQRPPALPRFVHRADVVITELPRGRPICTPQVIALPAGAQLLVRRSGLRSRA
jgi:hypothetical protein